MSFERNERRWILGLSVGSGYATLTSKVVVEIRASICICKSETANNSFKISVLEAIMKKS
jgi:hypothetical protein